MNQKNLVFDLAATIEKCCTYLTKYGKTSSTEVLD